MDDKIGQTVFDERASDPQKEDISLEARMQARFDTLRDLTAGEMEALNKRVLRKIDWRLMPCITLMFLMK